MPAYFFQKNIEKIYRNFQKVLDKMLFMWYNIYVIKRAQGAKIKGVNTMKKYTESEIFTYLTDNVRLLVEDGKAIYSVAVDDDGRLVDRCTDNEAYYTISNPAAYLGVSSEEYDAMEDVDAFYNKEDKDDADFMEIVADLTEKINAVIENL